MALTVLTDSQVKDILEDLTIEELEEFRLVLSSALHEFSNSTEAVGEDVYQQPLRISTVHSATKATSLYMPSCGPEGMGCKALNRVSRRNRVLLTPSSGQKVVSLTSSAVTEDPAVKPISPTGVLTLFTPDGRPTGLVHASTLTAFRTALASACLLSRRNHVRTLTVFGSGSQAYWHVRLALLMRGRTIKHVHIINRRFSDSAGQILRQFTLVSAAAKEREGWSHTKFSILTPTFHDFERLQKEQIRSADVIYCCTPSRQDLFEASILTSHEGRKKGRLVVAVGSYTPDMRELPEGLLHLVTRSHDKNHRHYHKHADEGGVIVVDTLEGVLKEAGEVIGAKISPNQMVELGELVMLHRLSVEDSETDTPGSHTPASSIDIDPPLDINNRTPSMSALLSGGPPSRSASPSSAATSPHSHARKSSFPLPFHTHSGGSSETLSKKEDGLARWLRDGTVVYKSVGLGLMDLVVGMHLVKVANARKIGTLIEGF